MFTVELYISYVKFVVQTGYAWQQCYPGNWNDGARLPRFFRLQLVTARAVWVAFISKHET